MMLNADAGQRSKEKEKVQGRKSAGQKCLVVLAAATALTAGALAQGGKSPSGKVTNAAAVDRGKYLVDGVARCAQCHTPVDSEGNPDRTQWLQGAPVRWVPAVPDSNWPLQAPRICGIPLPASD